MREIVQAETETDLENVRVLIRAFVRWLLDAFPQGKASIQTYYDGLEDELAKLPGDYAPPAGSLLLAYADGKPAGTVGAHPLTAQVCEMKRMFVLPETQGQGIGKALALELVRRSRAQGNERMRLDTSRGQVAAISMYHRLGFREVAPHYEIPPHLQNVMIFMERDLQVDA